MKNSGMTRDEKAYQAKVRDLGCILCLWFLGERSACETHHMLDDTHRRRGEMFVLALCPSHHRGGLGGKVSKNNPLGIMSRDHSKRRFEKHYGMTEDEMLDRQNRMIEQRTVF